MNKLSHYIGRAVSAAIFLVLLVVVGIDVTAALIDQLPDLHGDYTFFQALFYVLLTVPGRVYEYIPLSALVGCMLAMGAFSSSSELTVLRSSGVSTARLSWLACKPVLWLIVIAVAISEYISPYTDQWAQSHRDFLIWGDDRSLASGAGLWHRQGDTFMHFNVVQPGGVLYGVTTFEFDRQSHLTQATYARRASYQSNEWIMEGVKSTEFHGDHISSKTYNSVKWESDLSPQLLAYLSLSTEEMSPSGLYYYAAYLDQQELDSSAYRLAFWQKIFHPVATLSLVLVALSFVFGPLRSSTMGYRVFIGVIVGIAFQFSQGLLGPSSLIYNFPPLYGVLAPIVLCLFVAGVLLYRAR